MDIVLDSTITGGYTRVWDTELLDYAATVDGGMLGCQIYSTGQRILKAGGLCRWPEQDTATNARPAGVAPVGAHTSDALPGLGYRSGVGSQDARNLKVLTASCI